MKTLLTALAALAAAPWLAAQEPAADPPEPAPHPRIAFVDLTAAITESTAFQSRATQLEQSRQDRRDTAARIADAVAEAKRDLDLRVPGTSLHRRRTRVWLERKFDGRFHAEWSKVEDDLERGKIWAELAAEAIAIVEALAAKRGYTVVMQTSNLELESRGEAEVRARLLSKRTLLHPKGDDLTEAVRAALDAAHSPKEKR